MYQYIFFFCVKFKKMKQTNGLIFLLVLLVLWGLVFEHDHIQFTAASRTNRQREDTVPAADDFVSGQKSRRFHTVQTSFHSVLAAEAQRILRVGFLQVSNPSPITYSFLTQSQPYIIHSLLIHFNLLNIIN